MPNKVKTFCYGSRQHQLDRTGLAELSPSRFLPPLYVINYDHPYWVRRHIRTILLRVLHTGTRHLLGDWFRYWSSQTAFVDSCFLEALARKHVARVEARRARLLPQLLSRLLHAWFGLAVRW
jgi:hypothetical protein